MNGKDMKFNTLPVGKLAILVHPSCETLGNLIDQHLTNWRKARETDENEAMHYQDYVRDTFIIPSTCARFGTGEAKALLHDSVRGVDLYILADVLNYSLEYTVSGHRNHMSPDDIYADIKRLIAAASGKPIRKRRRRRSSPGSPEWPGSRTYRPPHPERAPWR